MSAEPIDLSNGGSLATYAYEQLRDALLVLDIRPGDPLHDETLARDLGVGRTPVREALKRLELDRLVVAYPRRGTFATAIDMTDLGHITQVRVAMEPLAASAAATLADVDARRRLGRLADEVAAIDPENIDIRTLMRHDVAVHRAIYRATGNPHLEDVLVRMDNLATRIWCSVADRLPTVAGHVTEHVDLLEAVINGRGDEAADLARHHVEDFARAVRAIV